MKPKVPGVERSTLYEGHVMRILWVAYSNAYNIIRKIAFAKIGTADPSL